ncbi:hypothetical protein TVAG_203790 [Trichomonas vaginalis G3]|uniref:Uncharacterized protein n=1 Tax=Trichomonas vaginalis (strain ATCC PRA-98 / G3) TaxID=412133 RepID=A2ETF5_TRIV3|nr:hypothetical protein TVAGG3_0763820 [Trichomonas vaginalis G3]EAY04075.1 hypothetical protein TVAG_203790 [Trichomonas vaginalis G3]KAI5513393.1 hypothetical protein TVAGG3_0763820 [Trichomonas vaginalis G3]|eukprot:XP_001316298.1 hypothetical protein [Trichomonas vaginalis G3]
MLVFLPLCALAAQDEVMNGRSIAVDITPGQDYVINFPLPNSVVIVNSIEGFSATAYDNNKNVIGTFSSSSRIMNLVESNSYIIVKSTGSQTKFHYSVMILSNLHLDRRCSTVEVHNAAQGEYKIYTGSNAIKCLWISSSSNMQVSITANIHGYTDIFSPKIYSAIGSIENSGTFSNTSSNPFIVVAPTDTHLGSVTVKTAGSEVSGIDSYSFTFTPSNTPGPITTGDVPAPGPGPQPTSGTSPVNPTSSQSGDDSDQGSDTPQKKDKVKIGLIVALVIVTLITVVVSVVIIFFFIKFRTLLKVL